MREAEIRSHLSEPRFSTYAKSCSNPVDALALYTWNAQVSAAFMVPLHVCEVVIRNAVVEAIENVYGRNWFSSEGFERSLSGRGRANLVDARRQYRFAGKVVAELTFSFWVILVTEQQHQRLWENQLTKIFPSLPKMSSAKESRAFLHGELDKVRRFRNRVAHHEPIFARNLAEDYERLLTLIFWRSHVTAKWLHEIQDVICLFATKP